MKRNKVFSTVLKNIQKIKLFIKPKNIVCIRLVLQINLNMILNFFLRILKRLNSENRFIADEENSNRTITSS